jgi:hypothetical protein
VETSAVAVYYRTAPIGRLSGAHPNDLALVQEKWSSGPPGD